MREYFYRYHDVLYSSGSEEFFNYGISVRLYLTRYLVVKHTPKGVWLCTHSLDDQPDKFILLSATKRWACPTKEEALESFKKRKQRQISILSGQIARANEALFKANEEVIE